MEFRRVLFRSATSTPATWPVSPTTRWPSSSTATTCTSMCTSDSAGSDGRGHVPRRVHRALDVAHLGGIADHVHRHSRLAEALCQWGTRSGVSGMDHHVGGGTVCLVPHGEPDAVLGDSGEIGSAHL